MHAWKDGCLYRRQSWLGPKKATLGELARDDGRVTACHSNITRVMRGRLLTLVAGARSLDPDCFLWSRRPRWLCLVHASCGSFLRSRRGEEGADEPLHSRSRPLDASSSSSRSTGPPFNSWNRITGRILISEQYTPSSNIIASSACPREVFDGYPVGIHPSDSPNDLACTLGSVLLPEWPIK